MGKLRLPGHLASPAECVSVLGKARADTHDRKLVEEGSYILTTWRQIEMIICVTVLCVISQTTVVVVSFCDPRVSASLNVEVDK